MTQFEVGDKVIVVSPGSKYHNKNGYISNIVKMVVPDISNITVSFDDFNFTVDVNSFSPITLIRR
mgnify:CR=1 FL=1